MIDARARSIDVLSRIEATSPSFVHQERQGREGGVESDREKMIDGKSPLPIGVPCAGWPAYGTQLLRREAGLSDVGSIRGCLGIQAGEGLSGLWKKASASHGHAHGAEG